MIGLNSLKFQQMQAGASGASNMMFGAGQQAAIGGTPHIQGTNGGVNTAGKPYESASLVDRLDKIDAGAVRPSNSDANSIDGYDGNLSAKGLTGVSGESIFVNPSQQVQSGSNFASLASRLDAMDYEMHPDTRDAFRGNRLYLEG